MERYNEQKIKERGKYLIEEYLKPIVSECDFCFELSGEMIEIKLEDLGETFDWYCLYELQNHVRKSKNNALLKFYTTNPAHAYTAREFEKTQETIKVEVVPSSGDRIIVSEIFIK